MPYTFSFPWDWLTAIINCEPACDKCAAYCSQLTQRRNASQGIRKVLPITLQGNCLVRMARRRVYSLMLMPVALARSTVCLIRKASTSAISGNGGAIAIIRVDTKI